MSEFLIEDIELVDGTLVNGLFEVTLFEDVAGTRSSRAASDLEYYGYTDIEWEWVSYTVIAEDGDEFTVEGEPKIYYGESDTKIRDKLIKCMREEAVCGAYDYADYLLDLERERQYELV